MKKTVVYLFLIVVNIGIYAFENNKIVSEIISQTKYIEKNKKSYILKVTDSRKTKLYKKGDYFKYYKEYYENNKIRKIEYIKGNEKYSVNYEKENYYFGEKGVIAVVYRYSTNVSRFYFNENKLIRYSETKEKNSKYEVENFSEETKSAANEILNFKIKEIRDKNRDKIESINENIVFNDIYEKYHTDKKENFIECYFNFDGKIQFLKEYIDNKIVNDYLFNDKDELICKNRYENGVSVERIYYENENPIAFFSLRNKNYIEENENSAVEIKNKINNILIQNNRIVWIKYKNHINYDIDNDGKDEKIEFKLIKNLIKKEENKEIIYGNIDISINGEKKISYPVEIDENICEQADKTQYIENYHIPMFIGVCDINKSDKSKEFILRFNYVYETGLDETKTVIFRYIDGKILKIYDESHNELSQVMNFTGEDKIYYRDGMIDNRSDFNKDYVLRYWDVKQKKIVENKEIIGKKIRSKNWIVYKKKEYIEDYGDDESKIEIAKRKNHLIKVLKYGEEIKILKIDKESDNFEIELSDGKRGWIGYNHFVWH